MLEVFFDPNTVIAIEQYVIDQHYPYNNDALSHQMIHHFKRFKKNFQSFVMSEKWSRQLKIDADAFARFKEVTNHNERQQILNAHDIARIIPNDWPAIRIKLDADETTLYLTK